MNRKNKMKALLAILTCMTSVLLFAGDATVTVTIPAGGSNTLDQAISAGYAMIGESKASYQDITAAADFVKKGTGILEVDKNLQGDGFKGSIHIDEGVLLATVNGALGDTTGGTFVSDNAQLQTLCRNATEASQLAFPGEKLTFAGSGPDGSGALLALQSGKAERTGYYGGTDLTLAGNATVSSRNNLHTDFPLNSKDSTLCFNGHTLTFDCPQDESYLTPLRIRATDAGVITAKEGSGTYLSLNGYGSLPAGASLGTVRITEGNTFELAYARSPNAFMWLLDWQSSRNLRVTTATDTTVTPAYSYGSRWDGPVSLNERMDIRVDYASDVIPATENPASTPGMIFGGKISGAGPLTFGRRYPERNYTSKLQLLNTANDFTGAVEILDASILYLDANGVLPKTAGTLSLLGNSALELNPNEHFWELPPVTVSNTVNCAFPDAVVSVNGSFTKQGDGQLECPIENPAFTTLRLEGGVLNMTKRRTAAGFWEGWKDDWAGWYNADTANTDYAANKINGFESLITYTNDSDNVKLSPVLFTTTGARKFGKVANVTYSGYFQASATETKTVSFLVSCAEKAYFTIESGKTVQNVGSVLKKTVTLTPGYHPIRLMVANTAASKEFKPNGFGHPDAGLAWKFGEASDNVNDYQPLVDPGDGSLVARYVEGVHYQGDLEQTLAQSVEAVAGTKILLPGGVWLVDDVKGGLAIESNGADDDAGTLRIASSFEMDAADVLANHALESDGKIEFAEGATVSVKGRVKSKRGGYVIASAAKGIVGVPKLKDGVEGSLSFSSDGKSLVLNVERGLKLMVR